VDRLSIKNILVFFIATANEKDVTTRNIITGV
jgi:hypothetical protein